MTSTPWPRHKNATHSFLPTILANGVEAENCENRQDSPKRTSYIVID